MEHNSFTRLWETLSEVTLHCVVIPMKEKKDGGLFVASSHLISPGSLLNIMYLQLFEMKTVISLPWLDDLQYHAK